MDINFHEENNLVINFDFSFVLKTQVECSRVQRLGRPGDGGWDVCLIPPYLPKKPCLVYSFGYVIIISTFEDISILLRSSASPRPRIWPKLL